MENKQHADLMPDDTEANDARRDEVLRRMLTTPKPKPKPSPKRPKLPQPSEKDDADQPG